MTRYTVHVHDNDSYAFHEHPKYAYDTPAKKIQQALVPDFSGATAAAVQRCSQCGQLTNKWKEPLKGLVIVKRRYDLSSTYDGIRVASERFRELCRSSRLTGLRFKRLPDDPRFYSVTATKQVEFDWKAVGTEFENRCRKCGEYESVIIADPPILKAGAVVPSRGFVRTDLEFASDDEKHPLLICGLTTGQILKEAKMKGIYLKRF